MRGKPINAVVVVVRLNETNRISGAMIKNANLCIRARQQQGYDKKN